MRSVTVSLDEQVVARARVEAARQGKSLSRFVTEVVTARLRPRMTQSEVLAAFLAGPPVDLMNDEGRAPTRDEIYGGDRLR